MGRSNRDESQRLQLRQRVPRHRARLRRSSESRPNCDSARRHDTPAGCLARIQPAPVAQERTPPAAPPSMTAISSPHSSDGNGKSKLFSQLGPLEAVKTTSPRCRELERSMKSKGSDDNCTDSSPGLASDRLLSEHTPAGIGVIDTSIGGHPHPVTSANGIVTPT